MKTDYYTKTVLTIIAVCLSILVLKEMNLISTANATTNSEYNFSNKNYGLVPLNSDGSINVRFNSNQIIDVRLKAIDKSYTWDAIKVKIE